MNIFNFSTRKVGGIRFVKLGRFNASFSVSKSYKPIGEKLAPMCSGPFWDQLEAMAAELRALDGNALEARSER